MKDSCKHRFAPVVEAINELLKTDKDLILVAIDGRCGCGKTTLGNYLTEIFDCNLFHMDDFFLQNHQRTPERLSEAGGNVDYERFWKEVLCPVEKKRSVSYRPFSCATRTIGSGTVMEPKRLNIVEGSYCQHPYFGDIYDLKIFMDIDAEVQYKNIVARNGQEKAKMFRDVWIPKEELYFQTFQIASKCLVIPWEEYQ